MSSNGNISVGADSSIVAPDAPLGFSGNLHAQVNTLSLRSPSKNSKNTHCRDQGFGGLVLSPQALFICCLPCKAN